MPQTARAMGEFVKAMRSGKVLVMDGAMGTELAKPPPRGAAAIHAAYTSAGAEVVLTNTFQANDHPSWLAAIRAAESARPKPRFTIGAIGPVIEPGEALAATLLAECNGLDGVLLETWSSLPALLDFARACPKELPLLVSFTYLHGGNGEIVTIDKLAPQACAAAAKECGASAIGANCGKEIDMADMLEIAKRYRAVCDLPIFVRPNAGTPQRGRSGWKYPRTPSAMAKKVPALLDAGVAMIGGCCGTTPAHIRAFRRVVDAWNGRGDKGAGWCGR